MNQPTFNRRLLVLVFLRVDPKDVDFQCTCIQPTSFSRLAASPSLHIFLRDYAYGRLYGVFQGLGRGCIGLETRVRVFYLLELLHCLRFKNFDLLRYCLGHDECNSLVRSHLIRGSESTLMIVSRAPVRDVFEKIAIWPTRFCTCHQFMTLVHKRL